MKKVMQNETLSLLKKYIYHYFHYVERFDIKDFITIKQNKGRKDSSELMLIFSDKTTSENLISRTKRAIYYFYSDLNIVDKKNLISFVINGCEISLFII